MFCLRSYFVLLFLPINASPIFILTFFTLTYLLNRPCIYCSALLLILFASSCHWSDGCFFDLDADWFEPRHLAALSSSSSSSLASSFSSPPADAGTALAAINSSSSSLSAEAVAKAATSLAAAAAAAVAGTGSGARAVGEAAGRAAGKAVGGEGGWFGSKVWKVPYLGINFRL